MVNPTWHPIGVSLGNCPVTGESEPTRASPMADLIDQNR